MSDFQAKFFLVFENPRGEKIAIVHVVNEDVDPSETDYQWLELCKYDSDDDQWKTFKEIDYVEKFKSYSVPEDLLD